MGRENDEPGFTHRKRGSLMKARWMFVLAVIGIAAMALVNSARLIAKPQEGEARADQAPVTEFERHQKKLRDLDASTTDSLHSTVYLC